MIRGRIVELEAVVAIAKRRSFRAAASELGLSPTALSQAIAELEGRLGVRLFNRTTRSVSPTAAGEQFAAEIEPALAAIRNSIEGVNQHRTSPIGVLRLNVSAGGARQILAPIIFEYVRRYPEMSIDIVTNDRLADIVKDGFDAGVRLAEHLPGDMIAVSLGPNNAWSLSVLRNTSGYANSRRTRAIWKLMNVSGDASLAAQFADGNLNVGARRLR